MPTTFQLGDLAIIGFSADTVAAVGAVPKSLAFVVLKDVEAGTVVNFTDNGWLAAGGFRANEGTTSYTFAANVPAGTVVTISGLTGSLNPSASGDQFLAYQGSAATPAFVFAVDFADNNTSFAADATSSNTSAVPTGLTAGTTALAFGTDNGAYTGPTSGTSAELLAAIANPANWTLSDASAVPYAASFTLTGQATSVSITGATITEGDAGEVVLSFTVTRSSTAETFTVDFATQDGSATAAGNDYGPTSGTLTFVAGGPASQQVVVAIKGDTTQEPNETFTVGLSNLVGPAGVALGTAVATGTIQNDDVTLRPIYEIQGAAHTSPFLGQEVSTQGVVTAIDDSGSSQGFYIQDPSGDGNLGTSDAVFVHTGGNTPQVQIGQTVRVTGVVSEFGSGNNLTVTQIGGVGLAVTVQNGGATGALPAATILGLGGRALPTSVIDDDGLTSYDPANDAIDFYESMEGMLVSVPGTLVVGTTDSNATWVVADNGVGATGLNARDGITIRPDDFNPERINIFFDAGVSPTPAPQAVIGDTLGDVTGVIGYFGGNYEVIATSNTVSPAGQPVARETTDLTGGAEHVTIAAYNVENLDPFDAGDYDPGPGVLTKFDRLALDIIQNLRSPDIIGLEEIQDSNGAAVGGDLSGAATLNLLISRIAALGGPTYQFVEVAPSVAGSTGGEPNGNIRNAYLYNPARVQYVEGSATLITGPDYTGTRKPLVAEFTFNGETITVVDLHSTSRLGSEQLFGAHQPPTNAGDDARIAQSQGVKDYVDALLAGDPDAKIVVMGDFNAFPFETSLTLLAQGGALQNLSALLTPEERYTYIFEGNSQQIDHQLVSQDLLPGAQFDIVHMNSGQPASVRATDHDAVLARLFVNNAPVAVTDTAAVNENQSVTINVLANDTDANVGDTRTLIGVTGGSLGGQVSIVGGKVVYAASSDLIDQLKQPQTAVDTITYQVQDAHGAVSTGTVNVTVRGVADAPVRNGSANADTLNGTSLEDVINGLGGNDKLVGNVGADTLDGGLGNDTLTGSAGADRFVFTGAFGKDVVTDFQANDVIQLSAGQFVDFGAVQAAAAQVGGDTVITLDAATTITLSGVAVGSLNAGDFLFV